MKETILKLLQTRFEGVSKDILSRIADKLAKTATTEDEANSAVEGVPFSQVLDLSRTEATQSAIRTYEQKYGLKDGEKPKVTDPVQTPVQPTPQDDITSKFAELLKQQLEPLQSELQSLKSAKITETRKEQLNKLIKDLPEFARKPYSRLDLSTMDDNKFEEMLKDIETETVDISKELASKGVSLGFPKTNDKKQDDKPSEDKIKAVVANLL